MKKVVPQISRTFSRDSGIQFIYSVEKNQQSKY